MKRSIRPIIRIDEDKCDGCGLCEKACHEGAIAVVDGKARLVSETYCDGLGACLGECPRGAIAIEDREAEEFDEEAARAQGLIQQPKQPACGCPGTMARSLKEMPLPDLRRRPFPVSGVSDRGPVVSRLGNWPVQLSLVPVDAPYLEGADLLLAADCSAFACPDFHERFLEGKVLLMGCPKLDDSAFYEEKVKAILARNRIKSVEVVSMEVPCCSSLVRLVQSAVEKQRLSLSLTLSTVGIRGEVIGKETIRYRFE